MIFFFSLGIILLLLFLRQGHALFVSRCFFKLQCAKLVQKCRAHGHGLRTPGEEIAFPARPEIKSQSQIFRYGRSILYLPHRPKFSDFFDFCLHWVSVVCAHGHRLVSQASSVRFSVDQALVNSKLIFIEYIF